MKLIICDCDNEEFKEKFPILHREIENRSEDFRILSQGKKFNHCAGCFSCLVKTPMRCAIQDEYCDIFSLFWKRMKLSQFQNVFTECSVRL